MAIFNMCFLVSIVSLGGAEIKYRTVGNFRGVLIFVDFVAPTQTTKNSLKICFKCHLAPQERLLFLAFTGLMRTVLV